MPNNLELKARIPSLLHAEAICKKIRARRAGILRQEDVYFCVRSGRLKLRSFPGGKSELIFYRRANRKGGRYSAFTRMPVTHRFAMKRALSTTMGILCVVKKRRLLYLYKNARIHLDRVNSLGTFIEFEVLVTRGRPQAENLFRFLVQSFGLRTRDSIAGSYADLLLKT